jgi:ABC-type antimicrobial peptide transport system permease subunit
VRSLLLASGLAHGTFGTLLIVEPAWGPASYALGVLGVALCAVLVANWLVLRRASRLRSAAAPGEA